MQDPNRTRLAAIIAGATKCTTTLVDGAGVNTRCFWKFFQCLFSFSLPGLSGVAIGSNFA